MSETENLESYEIYSYLDNNGKQLFTPSEIYARLRANFFGTLKVFIVKK